MKRCPWAGEDERMIRYHDLEWGRPVHDDRVLFEFLVLEAFQAGLSWATVLYKRDRFRAVFDGFEPKVVAAYDSDKITALLEDKGIIRNRLKVLSAITNAVRFLEVQQEFGSFDRYLWAFVAGRPVVHRIYRQSDMASKTELSDRVSKDMAKRGFKFVGSTIVYSYLQAVGVVDDHLDECAFKPSP